MGLLLFHIWGGCFGLAGLFLVFYAVRNALEGHASRDWQQVECIIRRSYVQVDTMGRPNRKAFTPMVEYEYQFNGENLKGSRIRYGKIGSGNRERAEKVLIPYPEGARLPLYVNLDKPQECTLQPGMALGNVFNLVAGAVFMWCGYEILKVKK